MFLEGLMTLMKEDPTMMPSTVTAQILADTIPAIGVDLLIGLLNKAGVYIFQPT